MAVLPSIRLAGASLALAVFLLACGSPPEEIKSKLRDIGQSDLEIIIADLPEKARRGALLPNPRYIVDEYIEFKGDTARVFQAYAALIFFYLDPSLGLCQQRKYRYRRSARLWERYEVLLRHFPTKYAGGVIPDSLSPVGLEKP